jgi:hypothetical protein
MSEVELNAAKKALTRRKKKKTNATSAAGVASPFDLKQVQGDFKKREPAYLDIIGGHSTHLSAKGVGGRRDNLREYAKRSGVSSAIHQGWVEMEEALSVQKKWQTLLRVTLRLMRLPVVAIFTYLTALPVQSFESSSCGKQSCPVVAMSSLAIIGGGASGLVALRVATFRC